MSRIAVPTFLEQHGMRACMVAPTKIIAGLGMSLGIDRLDAPGTTGAQSQVFLMIEGVADIVLRRLLSALSESISL